MKADISTRPGYTRSDDGHGSKWRGNKGDMVINEKNEEGGCGEGK